MNTLPVEGTLEWEIMKAHEHAANVLAIVYDGNHPPRGLMWRLQMLRAESILMKLMVREVAKRGRDGDGDLPKPTIPDPGSRSW